VTIQPQRDVAYGGADLVGDVVPLARPRRVSPAVTGLCCIKQRRETPSILCSTMYSFIFIQSTADSGVKFPNLLFSIGISMESIGTR